MLGDNLTSKIVVLSDRDEAQIRIIFADETKPSLDILMSEFIDVKSPKAKGKRFSTLDIAKIEDITPEPEVMEDAIESGDMDQNENEAFTIESDASDEQGVVDVPFTITNEVPEDSKPVDEQLSLF
jgi:topoisomerase-4 subunit A